MKILAYGLRCILSSALSVGVLEAADLGSCRGELAKSVHESIQVYLGELPPHIRKLYRGALFEGASFTRDDLPAVEEFSASVLRSFQPEERKIIYKVLKWPDDLVKHSERVIKTKDEDLKVWAKEGVVALGQLLRGTSLLVGSGVLGLGTSYWILLNRIEESNEEENKKDFFPFYEEDFEGKLEDKFHLSPGLKALPKTIKHKGEVFVRIVKTDLITGGSYVLYENKNEASSIRQIEVVEDLLKNVHDGYSLRFLTKNGRQLLVSYDASSAFHSIDFDDEFAVDPEAFLSLFAIDKKVLEKRIPSLAKIERKPETDFDKKYGKNFKLESSGVAVFDSGLDYSRSDLISSALVNKGEIPSNGIDDDKNGYVDDYLGYDFILHSPLTHSWPSSYHGSMVSEVVIQPSSRIKVLPIKQHLDNPIGAGAFRESIAYLRSWNLKNPNQPIRVINMSFSQGSPLMPELLDVIQKNPDFIFVAAAGNKRNGVGGRHSFPAEFPYDNVINVGSVDATGALSSFSGSGPNVDVVDNGQGVNLLYPDGTRKPTNGTSFAAPAVAALVAQMLLLKPNLTTKQIREIIFEASNGQATYPFNELTYDEQLTSNFQQATRGSIDRDKAFQAVLALESQK
ncbi:MAG: S8 family serine peptidase [Bdellovibrionota bacterium]